MTTDTDGLARWSCKAAKENDVQRAAALLNDGLSTPRMAAELGVSRTEGYRLRDRAREKGLL